MEPPTLVFLQLETTGFDPSVDQVVIIAAETSERSFSRKVVPTVPIKPDANEANHLSVVNGLLYYECEPLFSNLVRRRQAWLDFIDFLGTCARPLLVGHNVGLQERFVRSEVSREGLQNRFSSTVSGPVRVADAADVFREALPQYGDLQLREVARRELEMCQDEAWEMFAMPRYKLDLIRRIMSKLGVSTDTIVRHAVTV